MKKILFLALTALLFGIACSTDKDNMEVNLPSGHPLTSFAVQVGSNSYNAVIDHYDHTAKIGAITDLNSITGVDYLLGSETASIWPEPSGFVGNWSKEQLVVVTDKGIETPYKIIFTAYDDPSQEERPAAGEVIFYDDFSEGPIPNEEYWKLCAGGGTTWTKWFDDAAGYRNVKVEDGNLVLTTDKDGRYRTGGIRTTFGFPINTKVEVRARFTKAGGGFPAIWQMPVNGTEWPTAGEIDLMEWIQGTPNAVHHTVHKGTSASDKTDKSVTITSSMPNTNEWHVYAASRTEEAVTIYVDGNVVFTYANPHAEGEEAVVQYPYATYDFDIILNYSLGGENTWPGVINDSDLPAVMLVDWVKVTTIVE